MKSMKLTLLIFLFLGLCCVYLHGAEAGKAPEQSYAISEGEYDSYRKGIDLSENGEYIVSVYDYHWTENGYSDKFELFHKFVKFHALHHFRLQIHYKYDNDIILQTSYFHHHMLENRCNDLQGSD